MSEPLLQSPPTEASHVAVPILAKCVEEPPVAQTSEPEVATKSSKPTAPRKSQRADHIEGLRVVALKRLDAGVELLVDYSQNCT